MRHLGFFCLFTMLTGCASPQITAYYRAERNQLNADYEAKLIEIDDLLAKGLRSGPDYQFLTFESEFKACTYIKNKKKSIPCWTAVAEKLNEAFHQTYFKSSYLDLSKQLTNEKGLHEAYLLVEKDIPLSPYAKEYLQNVIGIERIVRDVHNIYLVEVAARLKSDLEANYEIARLQLNRGEHADQAAYNQRLSNAFTASSQALNNQNYNSRLNALESQQNSLSNQLNQIDSRTYNGPVRINSPGWK